jgi:hypothetical protein
MSLIASELHPPALAGIALAPKLNIAMAIPASMDLKTFAFVINTPLPFRLLAKPLWYQIVRSLLIAEYFFLAIIINMNMPVYDYMCL